MRPLALDVIRLCCAWCAHACMTHRVCWTLPIRLCRRDRRQAASGRSPGGRVPGVTVRQQPGMQRHTNTTACFPDSRRRTAPAAQAPAFNLHEVAALLCGSRHQGGPGGSAQQAGGVAGGRSKALRPTGRPPPPPRPIRTRLQCNNAFSRSACGERAGARRVAADAASSCVLLALLNNAATIGSRARVLTHAGPCGAGARGPHCTAVPAAFGGARGPSRTVPGAGRSAQGRGRRDPAQPDWLEPTPPQGVGGRAQLLVPGSTPVMLRAWLLRAEKRGGCGEHGSVRLRQLRQLRRGGRRAAFGNPLAPASAPKTHARAPARFAHVQRSRVSPS